MTSVWQAHVKPRLRELILVALLVHSKGTQRRRWACFMRSMVGYKVLRSSCIRPCAQLIVRRVGSLLVAMGGHRVLQEASLVVVLLSLAQHRSS